MLNVLPQQWAISDGAVYQDTVHLYTNRINLYVWPPSMLLVPTVNVCISFRVRNVSEYFSFCIHFSVAYYFGEQSMPKWENAKMHCSLHCRCAMLILFLFCFLFIFHLFMRFPTLFFTLSLALCVCVFISWPPAWVAAHTFSLSIPFFVTRSNTIS